MSKHSFGLVPAALLIAAAVVVAGDAPKITLPWDGFGVGTWVHKKSVTKMSLTMPGAPPMPETVTETKETLVKITDEAYTVKLETKAGDAWMQAVEVPYPRKFTAPEGTGKVEVKTEDLGTEKVTVDGQEFSCKKVKTIVAGATTVSWVSETHGALKSESEAMGTKTTMVVTALAKKATVGGKELTCRESKTVTKMEQGENTMVRLQSDAVPGHEVRMETTMAMAQMTNKTVVEVVAFEVK